MYNELINLVLKDAPILASVLLSPAAGVALKVLASFFECEVAEPKAVAAKIAEDSSAAVKLAAIDSLLGGRSNPSIKLNLEIHYSDKLENNNGDKSK